VPSIRRPIALLATLAMLQGSAAAGATPAAAPSAAPPVSRHVTLHARMADDPPYSACTAYVHPDGREYAVVGTSSGTTIVNVTDPDAPYEVGFIPGLASQWREMKSYRQWIYIGSEATGSGIQIVRMTDPENPVLVGLYSGSFNRTHTLAVDTTRALLIANGTRFGNVSAGMRVLRIDDPEAPVEIGVYGDDYVHDSWVRNDTLYAHCIQSGVARIFDLGDPYLPREITAWSYPNSATHSGETSRDGQWLYLCDERNYSTLKVFDMRNPFVHELTHEVAVNPLAIVHNVHVKADTAFVSWYTEGIRLFDVSEPSLPVEWGWYDTYGGFSGGFHGVWEVAHFPSGTFIGSDITGGLHVFRADPNYGTVKVVVTDGSHQPIAGADVVRVGAVVAPGGSGGGDSTRTQARGWAGLALDPGAHALRISKFGYTTETLPVNVTRGSRAAHDVTLLAAPSTPAGGTVVRLGDGEPLPAATITAAETPLRATSSIDGRYSLGAIPAGRYRTRCERAGYAPLDRELDAVVGTPLDTTWELLSAAWYDSCDTDRGWSTFTTGDHATTGAWERAAPLGTYNPGAPGLAGGHHGVRRPALGPQHEGHEEGIDAMAVGPVAPPADASPGPGGFCFVTGNGPAGGDVNLNDVDGGRTTLTSPLFDLTGMDDPVIGYERWYSMSSPGEPDSMLVELSVDGAAWVTARSIRESDPAWRFESVRVKDHLTPGAATQIRFVAQDDGPGGIVEAGIDDVTIWDASLVPGPPVPPTPPAPEAPAVLDTPRPNPARASATTWLRLARPGTARVDVFDVAGRRVATLWDGPAPAGALPLEWRGEDARSGRAASGVYWIRATAEGRVLLRRVVWVR
jgi:choice-of-anchor B domain-containing protein